MGEGGAVDPAVDDPTAEDGAAADDAAAADGTAPAADDGAAVDAGAVVEPAAEPTGELWPAEVAAWVSGDPEVVQATRVASAMPRAATVSMVRREIGRENMYQTFIDV